MSKKISRITAGIMCVISVVFFLYALNHPQAGFPWHNSITYAIYTIYLLIMILLFIAPFGKKKKTIEFDRENQRAILKCSICTGEQVAGFQDIHTGKFQEVMLIRKSRDMEEFRKMYDLEEVPKVY